jgi:hypothetical protein
VTLSGNMPEAEYRFHATAIMASGGPVLSGQRRDERAGKQETDLANHHYTSVSRH